ncbi:MAG: DUF1571 domain-containing protein [Planctomycetaceae bacterium]|nr:DUF1571 domain-containing protein [Planctomycetaceae bacterium]MBT6458858.1 DUF1571 domain-containing protein [Planctomycetaceae bacterium]MBT6918972.1 DUF1571 domain-containing protein [Planctomycetaceae bacterium]
MSTYLKKVLLICLLAITMLLCNSHWICATEPQAEVTTTNRIELPRSQLELPPPPPVPHPLEPAMQLAGESYVFLRDQVSDYSCSIVKQERIDGRLKPMEFISAKVRHQRVVNSRQSQRASIYLRFLGPEDMVDREVLWVEGTNGGKMVVRRGGTRFQYLTLELDPAGDAALQYSRYPTSESGMINMVRKLIDVGTADMQYGECEVQIFEDVKVDNRPCKCVQVVHPQRRSVFLFNIVRIFIDDEVPIPVRYEAYDWPASDSDPPPLIEEYTFRNIRLNVGFSDSEFQRSYSEYKFRPR